MSGTATRLSRSAGHGRPAAPVRIAHLGLGSFSRAHQAWYTDRAPDAAQWGIASFTGRSPDLARALRPQGGLYTLLVRQPDRDDVEVVSSLSQVHAATDHTAWLGVAAAADTAVVTLTVTEAGYRRGPDGHLDIGRADVRDDVQALRADIGAPVGTVPGRLVAGLAARRAAGSGPLTLLPCDNLPANGRVAATVVDDLARAVDPALARWIRGTVLFGTTMVDRITPATTDDDRYAVLAAAGLHDAAPVPTEPFSEWVVAADFPGGRPAWHEAGVTLVDDVAAFEERKLWLLNGAHSLLAYAGPLRGHTTVDEAMADPVVRGWVEQWWDEAAPRLSLSPAAVRDYRAALVARFANPRIRHHLGQIAADGSQKLPVRLLPVVRAELAAGRLPDGALRVVAAWVAHLRGLGAPVADDAAAPLAPAVQGDDDTAVRTVLAHLDTALARDPAVVARVRSHLSSLTGAPVGAG
ncbi:mannitol dehydrogenase family protein [Aquipuribacter nitratireducens]|uniref:Mannitol-1-phosphate 5-dehydrogenase n=1 Tax=Aquipuribacter nitratireducens TaxID=650104 RepID=A0ABW0GS16_9MICO